jgi:hemerythrin-like metal-binding protein
MIEAFVWSDRFETGIERVDSQHRELVGIVNEVGDRLASGDALEPGQAQALFKRLADYARFHFSDEERVMAEGGLDPRHIELHKQHHRDFTEQVVSMWQGRASMTNPAETLHGFLTAWLSYHILGEDQAMAREIARVRQGMAPAAAHELEATRGERSTSALLQAMQRLYGVLSGQNRDLAQANRALEDRVAERTQELKAAYAKLATDNQDLTELLAKVEAAQSQLLQSEKMASIGQLAAGVAHEINNPIGFVNSNLGTLGRYVDDLLRVADAAGDSAAAQAVAGEVDLPFLRTDLAALLGESRDGLERVRRIVANLKDFSHVDQEAEFVLADLVVGLESTIGVAAHELKYKTELVRELRPLPLVRCIPAQINQVFLNLLVNAAQAIAEHGVITVSSGQDRDEVWMEVADTGKGMDETTVRRMFEPFFTTKPVGTGTGLGMSICYDIVNKHGGRFEVNSTPGAGTRIRFWLPVAGPGDVPAGGAA